MQNAVPAVHAAQHHGPPTTFISKHVFSLDHKVIGKQYYALAFVAALCGMVLSWLMRFHLGWNNTAIPGLQLLSKSGAPGGVMTPELYLQLMTMHGTIMVFFVLTTVPQSGFGNYFLPIQIGAEDMAFPVLNMMSFWTTFLSLVVMVSAFFVQGGAPLAGWTAYLMSGDTRLPKLIGLKASRRTPLFNGALECRLYEYRLIAGSMRTPAVERVE